MELWDCFITLGIARTTKKTRIINEISLAISFSRLVNIFLRKEKSFKSAQCEKYVKYLRKCYNWRLAGTIHAAVCTQSWAIFQYTIMSTFLKLILVGRAGSKEQISKNGILAEHVITHHILHIFHFTGQCLTVVCWRTRIPSSHMSKLAPYIVVRARLSCSFYS